LKKSRLKTGVELLASLLSIDEKEILNALSYGEYRIAHIPKSGGRTRTLSIPNECLATVQCRILHDILSRWFAVSSSAHCSVRGRSVMTNVQPHRKSKYFLRLDFKDAFPSVSGEMVYRALSDLLRPMREPFLTATEKSAVAETITKLTIYNNQLPQGSSCSPCLMNLVCISMDVELQRFAWEHGIVFTRYMDDCIFSSHHSISDTVRTDIVAIINRYGFKLNEGKTSYCVAGQGFEPIITGVRVGLGEARVPRVIVEKYRATIFNAIKDESISEDTVFGIIGWVMAVEHKIPSRLREQFKAFLTKRVPNKLKDYENLLKESELFF
jgi:RNA-directed DNA polymerase